MTHFAIDDTFTIVAQFIRLEDCARFCSARNFTHLPFNAAKHAAPAVGSKYVV